jgi:probable HAF family extracellular repeat protein
VLDIEAVIWGPGAGEIHTLAPLPGDISAWATGVNDHGQVVGLSGNCVSPNFNATGVVPQHGVIWQNGTVTDLGNLGGTLINFPWAINSNGQVVGQSTVAGDTTVHTFLWQKGVMTDLGVVPGDVASFAFGLNDRGEVVGGSCDQTTCRAYLWQTGVMTDLNTLVRPGSTPLYLVFGNDINSRGEIATFALDQSNGEFHAAVAIPCDEEHAHSEGCEDDAQGTTTSLVGKTSQSSKFVVTENVREQLRQRTRFGRLGFGLLGRQ